MARTRWATVNYDTPQKGPRVPAQTPGYIVVHHAATESFEAVIQLELGARQVSSTVVIKDERVASMFDEAYRAWSLSSQAWDSRSLSSETCNSGGAAAGWPISEASYLSLARVIADWCTRYGIPCNRERILGHREVYTRYGASYATACPGGIDLDRLVAMAAALLNPASTYQGETMLYIFDTATKPARYALLDPSLPDGSFVTTVFADAEDISRVASNGSGASRTPAEFDKSIAAAKKFAALRPAVVDPKVVVAAVEAAFDDVTIPTPQITAADKKAIIDGAGAAAVKGIAAALSNG